MAKSDAQTPAGTDVETVPDPNDKVEARRRVSASVLQTGAPKRLDKAELRSLESWDDVQALMNATHGAVEDFTERYGSGFAVVDKSLFVGKPTVFLEWHFSDGDFGDKFVSVVAMAKDGTKGIINDGGTGICDQLLVVSFEDGKYGGVLAPKGLRKSTYDTCLGLEGNCGRPRKPSQSQCEHCGDRSERRGTGETYYIDETPAS